MSPALYRKHYATITVDQQVLCKEVLCKEVYSFPLSYKIS